MRSRDDIVVDLVGLALAGFGAWRLLACLIRSWQVWSIPHFLRVSILFYLFYAGCVAAGVGLWFRRRWARWLAVCVAGLAVIAVACTALVFFHEVHSGTYLRLPFGPEITPSYITRMLLQAGAAIVVAVTVLVLLLSRRMGQALGKGRRPGGRR